MIVIGGCSLWVLLVGAAPRIRKSRMCEDPRDVTAALHGDQADMLREGGSFDLTLACESHSKALSIFGEKH